LKDQKTITQNVNEENNQIEAKVSNLNQVLEEASQTPEDKNILISVGLERKKRKQSKEDLKTFKEPDGQNKQQDFQLRSNDTPVQNGGKITQTEGKNKKQKKIREG